MNRPRVAPIALLLLALLAACAPAAGSSGRPIDASAGPAPAARGADLLVRVDLSLADFGLTERDLTPSLWVPSGFASEVGDVSAYFGLHDVTLPPGWSIDLSQVKAERRSSTRASTGASSVSYSLWAEVLVRVAEDAIPGVYRVRGTLQARGGATKQIGFRVDVAP